MDWSAKKPADMLTKKEVLLAIDACTNSRDRAMISMLYDGSLRPVDLRKLTWQDVTFDEYGALIRTSAKTGKERAIRLTFSTPYFAQWRTDYPGEPAGAAPVFVNDRAYESAGGKHIPLEMDAIVRLIRSLGQKTGINGSTPPSSVRQELRMMLPMGMIPVYSCEELGDPQNPHVTGLCKARGGLHHKVCFGEGRDQNLPETQGT